MVLPNLMLTCDGAFGVRGLTFEDDSVLWGVLMNGYLEIDKHLCRPVMKMEVFLSFLSSIRFGGDVGERTVLYSKLFAVCHYLASHYAMYKKKRNTLIGYIRCLCKIANSVFCQLTILRYMGETHKNENLKIVFDMLTNPVEDDSYLSSAYINDALYNMYNTRLDFFSRVLCDCYECSGCGPCNVLDRVQPWRRTREKNISRLIFSGSYDGKGDTNRQCDIDSAMRYRRRRLHRPTTYLSGSVLGLLCIPDIKHMSRLQEELLVKELSKDLMQRYIHDAIDAEQLPLRLDVECMGRGFLEKATLVLLYNVTFTLFLISVVRKLIVLELTECKCVFLDLVSQLRCFESDERLLRCLDLITENDTFCTESLPGVAMAFMTEFRSVMTAETSSINMGMENRARVTLEHMNSAGRTRFAGRRGEISFARELRHVILSEYNTVNFERLRSRPDLTMVTSNVVCAVSGLFSFKAPLWFASCYRSSIIADMVALSARRRGVISTVEERAYRKRARRRCMSGSIRF